VHFMNCPSVIRFASSLSGPRRRVQRVILAAMASFPALVMAAPYELGQGYHLPFLGLTVGGYLSVQASALEGEKSRASLQDLSLLAHADPAQDWHFFTEIEVSNPVSLTRDGLSSKDIDLDFERFYVDHNLSARASLRVGKFLTPVGRWNQIHADPLVWTVSRPLTTAAAFAKNATGAQLFGSLPMSLSDIDYQLYVDDTKLLDPTEGHEQTFMDLSVQPNPVNAFKRGGGARLRYRTFDDSFQAGVSMARFQLRDLPGYKNMVGVDMFYTRNDAEFSGEMVYRKGDGAAGKSEWGGYVQAVLPLVDNFYGIVTHERYKAELFDAPVNSTSLGITYRPTPPFSIKLERRESRGEERLAPDGWLFSVAMMF
jgi:hypothetical protein